MDEMASVRKKTEGMGRIVTERKDHIFLIGIGRLEKYNGFTPKMCEELAHAYTDYEGDRNLRCAVLFAVGNNFTVGLQLSELDITKPDFFPKDKVDLLNLREPFRKKPVIAAIKGICFMIGIKLMLAADSVIAEEDVRFGQVEVKRGTIAFGSAMRFLLTGNEFSAKTAGRLGFVQEIVGKGKCDAWAIELAQMIARQAPLAVQAMRGNSQIYERKGPAAMVAAFDRQLGEIAATEDFAEGVQSFLERRDAVFKGI